MQILLFLDKPVLNTKAYDVIERMLQCRYKKSFGQLDHSRYRYPIFIIGVLVYLSNQSMPISVSVFTDSQCYLFRIPVSLVDHTSQLFVETEIMQTHSPFPFHWCSPHPVIILQGTHTIGCTSLEPHMLSPGSFWTTPRSRLLQLHCFDL